jgi:glycosyltransferase involved in cell wall biosynthesis
MAGEEVIEMGGLKEDRMGRKTRRVDQATDPRISVVIPVLDEEESIEPLYRQLADTLRDIGKPYEIVFVDDGSRDGSFGVMKTLYEKDREHVRVIGFRRNFGKTAALAAGFGQALGDIVITMDADLQDDPREIQALLDELDKGFDLIGAWRLRRQDSLSKTLPSRVFNTVVSVMTGVRLHDLNCGFKAYRKEVTRDLKLYGDLHRFIPVLAHWQGYRVGEVQVVHHPRKYGKSKYGSRRLGRGFLDFLMVLFLTYFLKRPIRFFGTIGVLLFLCGFGIGLYLSWLWVFGGGIGWRPILFVAILSIIVGVQMASIGLLGEMIRNFAYVPEQEYSIRQVLE